MNLRNEDWIALLSTTIGVMVGAIAIALVHIAAPDLVPWVITATIIASLAVIALSRHNRRHARRDR
jgi:uncharacterized membrane protein YoaK (UPF0700 family)